MTQRITAPVGQAQAEPSRSRRLFLSPRREPALQRKCACGGNVGPSGECDQCRNRRLQRNERSSNQGSGDHSVIPTIVHDVLKAPGQPLDSAARAFMEPRFSYDFSRVRVHAGPQAAESARAVSARAYTVGQDVVFDHGRYAPSTTEGKRLLAHELSHVVQQTGASPGADLKISGKSDPSEREASDAAERVLTREAGDKPVMGIAPGPLMLARDEQKPPPTPAPAPTPAPTPAPPVTPPPAPAPAAGCPTGIKVAGTGNLQMDASFAEAGLLTGFGGFAIMEVSDSSGKDWAGTAIHENLKSVKNTCGLAGACSNASGEGGAAGSTFKVGEASNLLGILALPSKKNSFYDQHMVIIKGVSLLHKAGLPACEIQCEQTYDCGGKTFGPTFLISYSLKRDTMKSDKDKKSIDVSSVDMSVAAKP